MFLRVKKKSMIALPKDSYCCIQSPDWPHSIRQVTFTAQENKDSMVSKMKFRHFSLCFNALWSGTNLLLHPFLPYS